jgi:hypothetical protein
MPMLLLLLLLTVGMLGDGHPTAELQHSPAAPDAAGGDPTPVGERRAACQW